MVMVAFVTFALSLLISVGEAICERDLPRDTFKFVIITGIVLQTLFLRVVLRPVSSLLGLAVCQEAIGVNNDETN